MPLSDTVLVYQGFLFPALHMLACLNVSTRTHTHTPAHTLMHMFSHTQNNHGDCFLIEITEI